MKRSIHFYLLVLLVLSALVLSGCGAALRAQELHLENLNPTVLAGTSRPTEGPEASGTPSAEPSQGAESSDLGTEKPEATDAPDAEGTSKAHGTPEAPGSDQSHEVLGVVSAYNTATLPNSITVNGTVYFITEQSVIHGNIVLGGTARLTFGYDSGELIVHVINVTNSNGNEGQCKNGNPHKGAGQETCTPEPGGNGSGSDQGDSSN